jgi:NAD(P)-dependent dehydrogenase (short-subunit alcohol dehydrogenase family)
MASALVTGASRGIGRAIAIQLALDGHDVALGYRSNEQATSEVVASIRAHGRRAAAIQADLAEPDAPETLIDRAQSELGPIGILVANAGVASPPTGIAGITDQAWEDMVALNLRAPFLLTRRLAPEMARAGFGRIVLISSVAAYTEVSSALTMPPLRPVCMGWRTASPARPPAVVSLSMCSRPHWWRQTCCLQSQPFVRRWPSEPLSGGLGIRVRSRTWSVP